MFLYTLRWLGVAASLIFATVLATTIYMEDELGLFSDEARVKAVSQAYDSCSVDTAKSVTFRELFHRNRHKLNANEELHGTCISVDAVIYWRTIIDGWEGSYRKARSGHYQAHAGHFNHAGLRGYDLMKSYGLDKTVVKGTVIGVLGDCSDT